MYRYRILEKFAQFAQPGGTNEMYRPQTDQSSSFFQGVSGPAADRFRNMMNSAAQSAGRPDIGKMRDAFRSGMNSTAHTILQSPEEQERARKFFRESFSRRMNMSPEEMRRRRQEWTIHDIRGPRGQDGDPFSRWMGTSPDERRRKMEIMRRSTPWFSEKSPQLRRSIGESFSRWMNMSPDDRKRKIQEWSTLDIRGPRGQHGATRGIFNSMRPFGSPLPKDALMAGVGNFSNGASGSFGNRNIASY